MLRDYEKVFNYYLLNEFNYVEEGSNTFLIIPNKHCAFCANTIIPLVDSLEFCPLTLISSKNLDLNWKCNEFNYFGDNGNMRTYNLPLENISIIGYRDGEMLYLHQVITNNSSLLKKQMDSLKTFY